MRQTGVLVTMALLTCVLAPLCVRYARRGAWSRARTVFAGLAGAGVALVPATTLARGAVLVEWDRGCLIQSGLSMSTPEAALNVLLLTPAAFFGVLATRRPARVLLGVIALAVLVEAVQSVTALGVCQTADVVRNVAGAAVAGGFAALLGRSGVGKGEPELAERAGAQEP